MEARRESKEAHIGYFASTVSCVGHHLVKQRALFVALSCPKIAGLGVLTTFPGVSCLYLPLRTRSPPCPHPRSLLARSTT